MAINITLIKKWTKMLLGKSVYHVNQDCGKFINRYKIEGYYNNLMEKVSFRNNSSELPITTTDDGRKIFFPIELAQYGLGAYDLFLKTNDEYYLYIAEKCGEWLLDNQGDNGGWRNFEFLNPTFPYSSMAQGEAVSLFARLFVSKNDKKYLSAAKKAIDFMLLPIEKGGTAKYEGQDIYLYEYTIPGETIVLNGWIFSIWGIYDYYLLTLDNEIYNIFKKSISSLLNKLEVYDCGYWTYYDEQVKIASPFYHRLHIAQLQALYEITNIEKFQFYEKKWRKYNSNFLNKSRAFIIKAYQKIFE